MPSLALVLLPLGVSGFLCHRCSLPSDAPILPSRHPWLPLSAHPETSWCLRGNMFPEKNDTCPEVSSRNAESFGRKKAGSITSSCARS